MTGTPKEKEANFHWTEPMERYLLTLVRHYKKKAGKGQQLRWKEITEEFELNMKVKCTKADCLKNKYGKLKTYYTAWKELKFSQTGLGWDREKGTIDATPEWWKEKLEVMCRFFNNFFTNLGLP